MQRLSFSAFPEHIFWFKAVKTVTVSYNRHKQRMNTGGLLRLLETVTGKWGKTKTSRRLHVRPFFRIAAYNGNVLILILFTLSVNCPKLTHSYSHAPGHFRVSQSTMLGEPAQFKIFSGNSKFFPRFRAEPCVDFAV